MFKVYSWLSLPKKVFDFVNIFYFFLSIPIDLIFINNMIIYR